MAGNAAGAQRPHELPYPAGRPAVAKLSARQFGPRKPPAVNGSGSPAERASRAGRPTAPAELADAWFDELAEQLDEASARMAGRNRR